MQPQAPQPNYVKRPVKRLRLPKIGPPKSKGLFEEYFYACLGIIFVVVALLLKAGGMGTYDAIVMGLWVTGLTWFARQISRYFKYRESPKPEKKVTTPVKMAAQGTNGPTPLAMKPIIGPQWPLKAAAKPAAKPAQVQQNPAEAKPKQAFVYERPTLPDRKPKLPANWPGRPDKKPKR
jgi:hypothetical protein